MASDNIILSVNNVSKKYGKVEALQQVSLSINSSELFGIIGPDGAGKTTLFRLIATLLIPDSGNIKLLGFDTVNDYTEIRQRIGYMPGRFSLYPDLSVEENLEFYATVFGTTIKENYELISDIYKQLEPFKTRLAKKLSGGMKQKLALCCALIHKPDFLILDEPTTGVDAVSRKEFWEMLKKLTKNGMSILVSTPYMDEANLCDRVAFMQHGKIMTIDQPEHITQTFPKQLARITNGSAYKILKDLYEYSNTGSVHFF
jgi:ABC-2 type transport system ATP-binding protein